MDASHPQLKHDCADSFWKAHDGCGDASCASCACCADSEEVEVDIIWLWLLRIDWKVV